MKRREPHVALQEHDHSKSRTLLEAGRRATADGTFDPTRAPVLRLY